MSKDIEFDISETEAASLDVVLDELLAVLRRTDEQHEKRWERIEQLRTETHVLMEQIRAALNVD